MCTGGKSGRAQFPQKVWQWLIERSWFGSSWGKMVNSTELCLWSLCSKSPYVLLPRQFYLSYADVSFQFHGASLTLPCYLVAYNSTPCIQCFMLWSCTQWIPCSCPCWMCASAGCQALLPEKMLVPTDSSPSEGVVGRILKMPWNACAQIIQSVLI